MLENYKKSQLTRKKEVQRLRKIFEDAKEDLRISTENENYLLKDIESAQKKADLRGLSNKEKEYLLDMDSEMKDAADESELIIQ